MYCISQADRLHQYALFGVASPNHHFHGRFVEVGAGRRASMQVVYQLAVSPGAEWGSDLVFAVVGDSADIRARRGRE